MLSKNEYSNVQTIRFIALLKITLDTNSIILVVVFLSPSALLNNSKSISKYRHQNRITNSLNDMVIKWLRVNKYSNRNNLMETTSFKFNISKRIVNHFSSCKYGDLVETSSHVLVSSATIVIRFNHRRQYYLANYMQLVVLRLHSKYKLR